MNAWGEAVVATSPSVALMVMRQFTSWQLRHPIAGYVVFLGLERRLQVQNRPETIRVRHWRVNS